MEQKQFNITWVNKESDLPNEGSICPKCGGVINKSQYGGFWCKDCKWKWKISQYLPKQKGETPSTDKIIEELDQGEEILEALRKVWVKLEEIHKDIKIGE